MIDTFVCQVSATDADEGSNGRIVYSFVTMQPNFILNSTTGEIHTTGSLDHEVQSIYNVSIVFITYMCMILTDCYCTAWY